MSRRDMMPGDKGEEDKDRRVKGENFLDTVVLNCARKAVFTKLLLHLSMQPPA